MSSRISHTGYTGSTRRITSVERRLPVERKNRFKSKTIAVAGLLLAISLVLICLSGCGGTLDVSIETPAAPAEAVAPVDAEVREANHTGADAESSAVPVFDVSDKVEEPAVDATPVVEDPPAVVPVGGIYKFADPALEGLDQVQKLLLRAGPDNAALIQAKAAELRKALLRQ